MSNHFLFITLLSCYLTIKAQTVASNCQDCRTVLTGLHLGSYSLDNSQQERCSHGECFYREKTSGTEVCMMDPGDTEYEGCQDSDVLLVTGGYSFQNLPQSFFQNGSEVYGSPSCSVPKLPYTGIVHVIGFFFNNQVLVCGGVIISFTEDNQQSRSCFKLESDKWVFHSNLSESRSFGSSIVVGEKVFMLGGLPSNTSSEFLASNSSEWSSSTSSEFLASTSSEWSPGPDIPGDGLVSSCAVALPGGTGFLVVGGLLGSRGKQVLEFDGSNWVTWANLTEERGGHSCAVFGETVIAAGGIVGPFGLGSPGPGVEGGFEFGSSTTVIINTVTKKYTAGPNLAIGRVWFAFYNVNGHLLAVGGEDKTGFGVLTGEVFHPSSGGKLDQNLTTPRMSLGDAAVVPKSFLMTLIGCPN